MFHKEGHKIIIITTAIVVAAILLIDELISIPWLQMLLQIVFLVFFILILQFFRKQIEPFCRLTYKIAKQKYILKNVFDRYKECHMAGQIDIQ